MSAARDVRHGHRLTPTLRRAGGRAAELPRGSAFGGSRQVEASCPRRVSGRLLDVAVEAALAGGDELALQWIAVGAEIGGERTQPCFDERVGPAQDRLVVRAPPVARQAEAARPQVVAAVVGANRLMQTIEAGGLEDRARGIALAAAGQLLPSRRARSARSSAWGPRVLAAGRSRTRAPTCDARGAPSRRRGRRSRARQTRGAWATFAGRRARGQGRSDAWVGPVAAATGRRMCGDPARPADRAAARLDLRQQGSAARADEGLVVGPARRCESAQLRPRCAVRPSVAALAAGPLGHHRRGARPTPALRPGPRPERYRSPR